MSISRPFKYYIFLFATLLFLSACAGSLDEKNDDELFLDEEAPRLTQTELIEMIHGGPVFMHDGNRFTQGISTQADTELDELDVSDEPLLKPENFAILTYPLASYADQIDMTWASRNADIDYYVYESNAYDTPFKRIAQTPSANYSLYLPDALGTYFYAVSSVRYSAEGTLTESDLSDQQFAFFYRDLLKGDDASDYWSAQVDNGAVYRDGIHVASDSAYAKDNDHISFENFHSDASPYIRLHAQANSAPMTLFRSHTQTNKKIAIVYRSNYYSPTLHDYELKIRFKDVQLTYNPRSREAFVNTIRAQASTEDIREFESGDEIESVAHITNIQPDYFNVVLVFYDSDTQLVEIRVNNRTISLPYSTLGASAVSAEWESPILYQLRTRTRRTLLQLFTVYGDT
ncbi:MAG: hypothetical protein O3A01_01645 [bacterium]|nr:hypothetical protein [bacterium]